MRKVREEVDEVIGEEQIRVEHVGKLKYISGSSSALHSTLHNEIAHTAS